MVRSATFAETSVSLGEYLGYLAKWVNGNQDAATSIKELEVPLKGSIRFFDPIMSAVRETTRVIFKMPKALTSTVGKMFTTLDEAKQPD